LLVERIDGARIITAGELRAELPLHQLIELARNADDLHADAARAGVDELHRLADVARCIGVRDIVGDEVQALLRRLQARKRRRDPRRQTHCTSLPWLRLAGAAITAACSAFPAASDPPWSRCACWRRRPAGW